MAAPCTAAATPAPSNDVRFMLNVLPDSILERSTMRRKRCARPSKRGSRAGISERLKAKPNRPAYLSILLSNIRLLENKMDYLRLDLITQWMVKDCSAIVLTETWLYHTVPDNAIQVDGLTTFRADRSHALTG